MNFNEQLEAIQNFNKSECCEFYDFMADYENINLEQCLGTSYRHRRLSNFSDGEIVKLGNAVQQRISELF